MHSLTILALCSLFFNYMKGHMTKKQNVMVIKYVFHFSLKPIIFHSDKYLVSSDSGACTCKMQLIFVKY
jgi:hypothetical protein